MQKCQGSVFKIYQNRALIFTVGCGSDFSKQAPNLAGQQWGFYSGYVGRTNPTEPYCTAGVHLADGLKSIISTDCCAIG